MSLILRRLREQRGQAIIMFVGVFTIIALAGAVAVDVGLWLSERRGAQTDTDLVALAGAWELIDPNASEVDAQNAASQWFADNDEQGNAALESVIVDDSCFPDGRLDAVSVDVSHESRALFASIFGVGEPDIGAHAKACAGGITGISDAVPIQIDDNGPCFDASEQPIFTQMCILEFGAQDSNPRGIIDLDNSFCSDATGSGDITDMIANGSDGTCRINTDGFCDPTRNGPWYDCAAVQTGNPKKVIEGFSQRIAREGSCDDDASGVEEFEETVTVLVDTGDPTTSIYEPRECPNGEPSPRIITIIVFEEPPTGSSNLGHPIVGFAGFYTVGCYAGDDPPGDPPVLDFECTELGPGAPPGHVQVFGRFVKLVVSGGDVGPPDPNSTLFGIALVE